MSRKMINTRDNSAKISCTILGEQRQLVVAERELMSMLDKVNVELNQLLVEELQLKSNDIAMISETKQRSFQPKAEPNINPTTSFDSAKDINQQQLDLSANDCFSLGTVNKQNDAHRESEEEEDELL